MNQKYKILIYILIILLLGLAYWLFFLKPNLIENGVMNGAGSAESKKLNILAETGKDVVNVMPIEEKREIFKELKKEPQPTSTISEAEKLQIMNNIK